MSYDVSESNLVRTESDKVQWLCEVSGCTAAHATLALKRSQGNICDALDVLPEVVSNLASPDKLLPAPGKRKEDTPEGAENSRARKRTKSSENVSAKTAPKDGIITIEDDIIMIDDDDDLDSDDITTVIQLTGVTATRANAVLDMVGRNVKAAVDCIKCQNYRIVLQGESSSVKEDPTPKEVKVLCWNIDGLSDEGLQERLSSVISLVKNVKPDVVLLQEVVHEHVHRLIASLGLTYHIVWGDRAAAYFNAVLIVKKHSKCNSRKTIRFPGSIMGRHIVLVQCTMYKKEFTFLTSHFESLKENAQERVSQLNELVRVMDRSEGFVVFGGDTNLRAADCAILPDTYHDLWELSGRPNDLKYTWDMAINHNLKMNSKCALRFDRMYARKSPPIKVKNMRAVGKTKLISCDLYPSDHWGILASLSWD